MTTQAIWLGRGSSRDAYDLGNGQVKKRAYCRFGFHQNSAEAIIWRWAKRDGISHLFCEVFQLNGQDLIMEKVQPLSNDICAQSRLYEYWGAALIPVFADMVGLDVDELRTACERYRLNHEDFLDPRHWGTAFDGQLKCFDYGCTQRLHQMWCSSTWE